MKYLITGHKGFIGTNLVNYLQSFDEKVVGVDYPIDITDPANEAALEPYEHCDVIVHLAAETNVRHSITQPNSVFIRNCQSTVNMLNKALDEHSKFIFISSCGAQNPTNPYSASKVAGEAICRAYRKSYNMDISIIRLSNVYGPYSIHKESVITKFIKAKLKDEKVTINGTGHQMRDFVYVEDVCKAIHQCHDDYVEVSTGILTSINTIAKMIGVDYEYGPPIDGEIFHPETHRHGTPYSLQHGLMLTIEWFEDNYK